MYDLQDWAAVQRVYKQTRSKRATAKILGMSRNTVRSLLEEKVNPKLTAYQVELAQVETEIEKLLDTLTGANATLLAYANKKIEELDTRRQTISKAIAELSVETISPQQIKKLSYYLDNWDSIDFDDKRKAADGLISTIKATSDRVQIEWKI